MVIILAVWSVQRGFWLQTRDASAFQKRSIPLEETELRQALRASLRTPVGLVLTVCSANLFAPLQAREPAFGSLT